jgi:hypothetical protein
MERRIFDGIYGITEWAKLTEFLGTKKTVYLKTPSS